MIRLFRQIKCLLGFHREVTEAWFTCDSRDTRKLCGYCEKNLEE